MMIPNFLQANNVKNSAVIFMYHKFDQPKYPSTNINMDQFKAHLDEFSKPKYNVLSLKYIIDTIKNDGVLPENTVGFSVDDADRSFLEKGWPLFKEKGFPVTLFVTTNTIFEGSKNYLSWDEIRRLELEGVTIGSHSHSHHHMSNLSLSEVKEELEISNRIFLRELGKIPSIFAYPYGEADENFFELLKDYNFDAAFGQHSGTINETSNFYYLPRFSLNQKYGELDRVKFAANTKGMGIYDFIPTNPNLYENPPFIGFSLLDQNLTKNINCFIYDSKGQLETDLFIFNERVEIRLNRKLGNGRSRMNCTAKDKSGNWRWFGHQFYN